MIESEMQPNIGRTAISAGRPKFKRLKLILLLAAIGLTGVIFLGLTSRAANTKAFQQVSNDAAQIRVQVVFPQKLSASIELQLPGQTQAFYQAPIFAQTNGYLKNWNYDIGAEVKAGDILGEIDTPEVDQQLVRRKLI
jgi:multidrug efflux pump subunit AcrA (membrane-fusion protein)